MLLGVTGRDYTGKAVGIREYVKAQGNDNVALMKEEPINQQLMTVTVNTTADGRTTDDGTVRQLMSGQLMVEKPTVEGLTVQQPIGRS